MIAQSGEDDELVRQALVKFASDAWLSTSPC